MISISPMNFYILEVFNGKILTCTNRKGRYMWMATVDTRKHFSTSSHSHWSSLGNGYRLIRASHTQFNLYGHNSRLCYIQRDFSCINIDFTINHNKWYPFLFVVSEKSPVWFISTSCPETPYQPQGVMKETWLKPLFTVTCDLHIISTKINNFVTMQFSLETVE